MSTSNADVFDLEVLRKVCMDCAVHELCLPAGISGDDVRQLDSILHDRRPLEPGATLYHAGSRCEVLHLVRSGCLMSVLPSENGDSQVIGFHLPGEIIGLEGMGTHVHSCTTTALDRSRVCEMSIDRLFELTSKLPAIRDALARVVSREMVGDHAHLALMGKRLAHERLASFLLSLSLRYSRLHRDPHLLRLSMSRKDIASYLGLAVETVSRLFTRFQNQGLLDVRRRVIHVRDLARLKAVCDGAQPEAPIQSRSSAVL